MQRLADLFHEAELDRVERLYFEARYCSRFTRVSHQRRVTLFLCENDFDSVRRNSLSYGSHTEVCQKPRLSCEKLGNYRLSQLPELLSPMITDP